MSRYIDADKIKYYCKQSHECLSNAECKYCDHYTVCKVDIDIIPTAEVKPIVYGEWIDINGIKTCNQCAAGNASAYDSFCPNCGAFMKKESEEGIISETSMHHLICAFCDNDKCVRETKECEFEQWKEKEKEK